MPRRLIACAAFGLLLVPAGWWLTAADPVPPAPKRVPWTTSKVTGSPDAPPPFVVTTPFPNIKLKNPLLLARQSDLGRLFVAEQGGKISSFVPGPDAKPEVFFDPKGLRQLARTPGQAGFETVYGMAFHPKFQDNRTCFVCYTLRGKDTPNLADGTRVSKFTVPAASPPAIDPASEVILLTFPQGGHNGGDLHFGPDGMLYVSAGDAAAPNPPDSFKTGQDISDLLSSILRIDVDHADPGKTYAIPKDNPFVGVTHKGKPARGEVWSYGYRNPWRMSFDRATGDLWVGDVGWELWEMVHKATRGSNAGWSRVEGRQPINSTYPEGPTPVTPPVIEIPHTAGASMTGGYVYRGKMFPDLVGQYIFGDWETRRIWAAKLTVDGKLDSLRELVRPSVRVVAFGEDAAGEIYFLDYDAGTIHSLARNTATADDAAKFPRTLSSTGLFRTTATHAVADGVRPFAITARQWQDGATAEHFVALPGDGVIVDHGTHPKPLPGNVNWHNFRYHFPAGAVLVKTLSLNGRRVETQLMHFDGENWNAYTYAWRDDQADADLVPAAGAEKELAVPDRVRAGQTVPYTWQFGSRAQCAQCHNSWSEYTLAFTPLQLNTGDQLAELTGQGVMRRVDKDSKPRPPFTPAEAAKEPKFADPHGQGTPADRAKGYLHANCGHCHRFGGGGSVDFELHAGADLNDKKLRTPPTRGAFDIPAARVVAPGRPGQSVLLYRMAKFGSGRMPHLGSEVPDPHGLALVRDWIRSLESVPAAVAGMTDVPAAVELACTLPEKWPLEQVAKLPPGPVRDLFEGYLPADRRVKKLGPNPKPATILDRTGDATRGAELFRAARSQCTNCHQVAGVGKNVGPDLTSIGKTRTRDHLLESLLEPSKKIELPYQAYLLRTVDGRALTGTLVRKTAAETVLKTADGTEVRVAAADIETVQPSRDSLMPAGLLADWTAQEAADLLAYLEARK